MTESTKRAAIYARVSSDEQAYNFSLDSQIDYCRKRVIERGYVLIGEPFKDDYTGTELDRPKLDKLRDLASKGQVDIVVCLELDRWARGLAAPIVLEQEFKKLGATVEYVLEQYEDTPEGALKKGIRATISEYERLKIRERTGRGRIAKAKSGSIIVGKIAKYGYVKAREGKSRHTVYKLNPIEAEIVLKIYEWYVNGDETGQLLNTDQIARRLSSMKIPTRLDALGGKYAARKRARYGSWSKRQVNRVLRDEIYKGVAYYGQTKSMGQVNGKRHLVARDRSEWIALAGPDVPMTHHGEAPTVPAIVTPELWQAAQDRMASNKVGGNRRNNTVHQYLMRSRLKCAVCGKTLQYQVDKRSKDKKGYYFCSGTKACDMVNHERTCKGIYPQAKVDALIWGKLAELLKNPHSIQEMHQRSKDDAARLNDPICARLEIVRAEIDERTEALKEVLYLHTSKSAMPRELLEQRAGDLNREIESFQAEQRRLQAQLGTPAIDESALVGLLAYSEQVRQGIDYFTFEDRQSLVAMFDLHGMVKRSGRDYAIEISGQIPQTLTVTGTIKGQKRECLTIHVQTDS